jgi:nitrile hydratase
LTEKGLITEETVDKVLEFFEKDMGPFNGARIVAKAWVDSDYKKRLLEDTPSAILELKFPLGMTGAEGEHMKAVENTPHVHNLIVCTMCSCYPWPVLGLPPYWFKDPTFRARAIREPRKILKEFGLDIPQTTQVRVWDTSAQIRWFVVPERPEGTEGWTEQQPAAIVTPEAMQGAAKVIVSA